MSLEKIWSSILIAGICFMDGKITEIGTITVPVLKPYGKTNVNGKIFEMGKEYMFVVTIQSKKLKASKLTLKAVPVKE